MSLYSHRVFAVAVIVCCSSPTAPAATYTARLLHPGGIFLDSAARGISGASQVGWGTDTFAGIGHALLWNGTLQNMVDLHAASGYDHTKAEAVSGNTQVGSGGQGLSLHALLWHGTADSVVDLHPASGFDWTEATGVAGDIQVGWGEGSATGEFDHALLWSGTAASVVDLNPSGYFLSRAHGASGSHQIGWGATIFGGFDRAHALLWNGTADSFVDLHPPGDTYMATNGYGISGNSQVGYARTSGPPGENHAALWHGTAASFVDLHPDGFQESYAYGVAGGMQVGYGRLQLPLTSDRALVWHGSAESAVDLQPFLAGLEPTLVDSQAFAINANGDIVGAAHDNAGRLYAVLWIRVPEPSALALVFCGLLAMLVRRH